jgi:nucleoside-diphosphate-sugar epimerase
MRILFVGASGVLGRATLPHLGGHEIVGTTRSPAKRDAIAALGARAELCDVYEPGALERLARAFAPEVVVNFLTDLAAGPGPANSRIRLEGGPIVTAAARAAGARRLVVESIAFDTGGASEAAVAALESGALGSGLEALVLRFGRFWGPETWATTPPAAPAVHVDEAGRRAAALILAGSPGTHVIVDGEATETDRRPL